MAGVEEFIEQFTYLGLFLVLFAAALGLPIPEEVPVIAAGVFAHEGLVRWWVALPVCFAGVLSGDVLLYWIGHHWGERVLAWRPVRCVLSVPREQALKAAYRRHGAKIVITARHVVGLRAAAFITAGIARVPFVRFLVADACGALLGVPLVFGLSYFFTDQVQQIATDVHRIERWLVMAALVAVATWLVARVYRRTRELGR
ncbi:MAG TPA: DedA family protein [Candidatus Tectomicrobia bacterium]|nr:DedA family protein [Candidatus Tectomicrobia bacterium]